MANMIIGLIIAYCVLEAWNDYHVIQGAGHAPSQQPHNRAWHKTSAAKAVLFYTAVALFANHWIILVLGLSFRLLTQQVVLNLFRSLPINYLGDNGIDGWCKRNLGEWAATALKVGMVLAVLRFSYIIAL